MVCIFSRNVGILEETIFCTEEMSLHRFHCIVCFCISPLSPYPENDSFGYSHPFLSTCAFQLANTEEYIDGALAGQLGEVFIRCNNILYIRGVEEEEEDGEMRD